MRFEPGELVHVTFGDGVDVECVVVVVERRKGHEVVVVQSLDLGDVYRVIAHPMGIRPAGIPAQERA